MLNLPSKHPHLQQTHEYLSSPSLYHMSDLDFLWKIKWLKRHCNFKPAFEWVQGLQEWEFTYLLLAAAFSRLLCPGADPEPQLLKWDFFFYQCFPSFPLQCFGSREKELAWLLHMERGFKWTWQRISRGNKASTLAHIWMMLMIFP